MALLPEAIDGLDPASRLQPLRYHIAARVVRVLGDADGKAAQTFTLAHELAHLWIDQAAVFNVRSMQPAPDPREAFCNAVAAECLVRRKLRRA
jgi:Zn-dependent peptidase ImmA (M78 family)